MGEDNTSPYGAIKKQALLIADSMGEVFQESDPLIEVVTKAAYTADRVIQDVIDCQVNIQYDNIILWIGAHTIHYVPFDTVADTYRSMINIIRSRNSAAIIAVSTIIPKPRENHLAADKIARLNNVLGQVVASFDAVVDNVLLMPSHRVFLDETGDIIRPIIDNYHDGFHLNHNGMRRLQKYWIQQLELSEPGDSLL